MRDGASVHEMSTHSKALAAFSYMAMSALAICMVPKKNLLVLNVFEQSDAELWRQLRNFLDAPDARDPPPNVQWPHTRVAPPDSSKIRAYYESVDVGQRGTPAMPGMADSAGQPTAFARPPEPVGRQPTGPAEAFGPQFIWGKPAAGHRPPGTSLQDWKERKLPPQRSQRGAE